MTDILVSRGPGMAGGAMTAEEWLTLVQSDVRPKNVDK